MPRMEFDGKEEYDTWAVDFLNPEKYKVFYTGEGFVIAVPLKSTQPIEYGFVNLITRETAKEFAESLQKKYGVRVYSLKHYAWDASREPLE